MKDRIDTNPHLISFSLKRNKNFPNNHLPVLIYKGCFLLPNQKNKAADIVQKIFISHGWSNSWRNGIYDFHHYHSTTHECLGISMGTATVILGGPGGKRIKLTKGDLLILPAGVGHKCSHASEDFQCVGAYPQGKDYDINYGTPAELKKNLMRIQKLSIPAGDPVFGKHGFLRSLWNK